MADNTSSRLRQLQERISIATWLLVLLLSLRGLYAFYGMKQKGSFERGLEIITDPVVQMFQFKSLQNIDIPGITVFFATISLLLASSVFQFFIKYSEYRLRARSYVAQQLISVK